MLYIYCYMYINNGSMCELLSIHLQSLFYLFFLISPLPAHLLTFFSTPAHTSEWVSKLNNTSIPRYIHGTLDCSHFFLFHSLNSAFINLLSCFCWYMLCWTWDVIELTKKSSLTPQNWYFFDTSNGSFASCLNLFYFIWFLTWYD